MHNNVPGYTASRTCKRARPLVALGTLLLLAGTARGAVPEESGGAVTAHQDTVFLGPGEQLTCLRRPYVLRSTLELREGERALLPVEFALDDRTGCLTVYTTDTLGVGRTFVATYRALAVPLAGTYRLAEDPHRRGSAGPPVADPRLPPPRSFTEEEYTRGLNVSGSNTLGIEIGSRQDAALRQALDLRLTGKVSRDVSLLAILSDQDIPFQPEGNTAELEELDRVLVEITSPRAGATLGDLDLSAGGFAFLEVSRELEGVTARAQAGPGMVRGALASAKGEFATREFFAVDGKQGPYRLTDRTGAQGIVIVAGSEKIWLDGALLSRGEEADYVIDYAAGEITLTSRHVLTATSRLTADYQVATGRYRRGTTLAAADPVDLGFLGRLRAAFFREGDDADHVQGGDLSDPERALLAALGDSATVQGGTRYVGPGCDSCAYTLAVDPETGQEIFVYVEAGGDYVVTFVNVGENQGEYEPDPELSTTETAYSFVGVGRGRFIPRRDLPAPQTRRLGTARWEWSGPAGGVALEGALSQADVNTLSPLNDEDNAGHALVAEFSGRELRAGRAIVVPRARWRRVSADFESPGRIRPGFYGRTWNLVGTEAIRDENLLEGGFDLRLGAFLRWNAEAGRLALADTFTAYRQRQEVRVTHPWVRVDGDWALSRDDVNDRSGRQDRVGGTAALTRWPVQPRFTAAQETRRRAAGGGERMRTWEAGLGFPLGALRAEIGGGRRFDDSLEVALFWRDVRETDLTYARIEGALANWTVLGRIDRRRVLGPGTPGERRDSARLDLHHQGLQGAWRGSATLDLGTVGLVRRTKSIVPDSTGAFDRFGNYVGPGAGYDVLFGAPGPEDLVRRVDASSRVRWYPPGDEVQLPRLLRLVGWEGFLNVGRGSARGGTSPALDETIDERQTVEILPRNARAGLRLRQEATRRLSRSAPSGTTITTERRGVDDYGVAFRFSPDQAWDGEIEGTLREEREEVDLGDTGRYEEITLLRGMAARGGRRLGTGRVTGRASLEGIWNRETRGADEAQGWTVRPRVQGSLGRRARLEVRGTWTELVRRDGFTIVGARATSLREGWRIDTVAEVRVTAGIVLTATVALDRPRDLARQDQMRLEARGSF